MLSVAYNSTVHTRRHNPAGAFDAKMAQAEIGGAGWAFSIAEKFARGHKTVAPGMEVYAEGEPCDDLYIVTDGWLFLHQILEDGRRQILDFALPGTVLGFQTDAECEMTHTAEALTRATVAIIPRDRLGEIFAQQPDFAMRMVSAAAGALNVAYESLTDIGRRTAREAVAHLALRLFGRICDTNPQISRDAIAFPLTQEHIGDALGLTAVHVCRTLRGLREEGVLTLCNGTLRILDIEELAEIAGGRVEILLFEDALAGPARRPDNRRRLAS